ncbi:MAG TPA: hypothetical protein VJP80_06370 [Candidatus Saccharimonadales bacterium]|nr:hypothetical protein [Candidatus Saccharimonadales bacterium]
MRFGDKPHVPYSCPALETAFQGLEPPQQGLAIKDDTSFYLGTSDFSDGPNHAVATGLEVCGYFQGIDPRYEDETTPLYAATEGFDVAIDSDLATAAEAIEADLQAQIAMGQHFASRITECHGVVDGTCWALSAEALEAALREYHKENL